MSFCIHTICAIPIIHLRPLPGIVSHFKHLAPDFDPRRICIKIPSTWEGIQACRELEKRGVSTLATTLFCLEQAALAADAGCRYIAPYVNELRVHFEPGYVDPNKGAALLLCGVIQRHLELGGRKTPQVVAASLTSIEEVMQLAGLRHITVSPPLLAELAATPAVGWTAASIGLANKASDLDSTLGDEYRAKLAGVVRDEASWRMAVTRSEGGRNETKLVQAINIFTDMQDRLEEIVRKAKM